MTHSAENGARCQSDGGISVPGNHRCECRMRPGHEGRHGCHCGAMWTCWDCPEADPGEGCAGCGALPEGSVFPPAETAVERCRRLHGLEPGYVMGCNECETYVNRLGDSDV